MILHIALTNTQNEMLIINKEEHVLKPRTINVIQLKVTELEGTELVTHSQELGPGMFIGNGVDTVKTISW